MPHISTTVRCNIHDSFRVQQVAGMFDLPAGEVCTETFTAEIPSLDDDWSIGAIVGASGSGKSTIARAAVGKCVYTPGEWPAGRAVIDGFGDLPIRQITRTLTAVGFGSPPSWLKPHAVLSTGEKFRCELARALLRGASGTGGSGTGVSPVSHRRDACATEPVLRQASSSFTTRPSLICIGRLTGVSRYWVKSMPRASSTVAWMSRTRTWALSL